MAVSTIKNPLDITGNDVFSVGGLEFRTATVTAQHKTWTTATFTEPFTHVPMIVIAYCGQAGFGSPCSVSYQNTTVNGTQVYQSNGASTAMQVRVLAIGY